MATVQRTGGKTTVDTVSAIAGVLGVILLAFALIYEDIVVVVGDVGFWNYGIASLGSALLFVSTVGLRRRVTGSIDRPGRAGIAVLLIAYAAFAIGAFLITLGLIHPYELGRVFGTIGMLGTPIGTLLLGLALWRRTIGPRVVAASLMLALPGQFAHIATVDAVEAIEALGARGWGILFFVIPFALGWIGLCYRLWTGTLSGRVE